MNFEDNKEKSLADFVTIFHTSLRKYWRIALGPALVLLALTLIASARLKDYYTADFLVQVQGQRIRSNLVDSPDRKEMGEKMNALFQEILSRPRLRKIREQFGLYPKYKGPVGKEEAVKRFRGSIKIAPAISATGERVSGHYKVHYTNNIPKKAFEVAQAISDLFVEESLISDRIEIQGTKEFLDAEVATAQKKLEKIEADVTKFIGSNSKRLPGNLEGVIARLDRTQQQLSANSQQLVALIQTRENLESEYRSLVAAGPALGGPGQVVESNDPYEQLNSLKRALTVLESKYSPKHPDVINTKKRISALERQIRSSGGKPRSGAVNTIAGESGRTTQVRRQRDQVSVEISRLQKENSSLKDKIVELEQDIQEMPKSDAEYQKIVRQKETIQAQFDRLVAAREEAQIKENVITRNKGVQFKIVEPAELPNIPTGPNRIIIIGAGLIAALGAFLVIPFIVALLNGSYKFTGEVENELDLEVIGVIPPMVTPHSVVDSRRIYALCTILSLLVLTGGTLALFVLV
jgi:polysaccharide chain length determinant protein (PEP-CTERM system associated)